MHSGTFKDTKKAAQKMFNGYEQELGDIRGLTSQNDFPLIFPKN